MVELEKTKRAINYKACLALGKERGKENRLGRSILEYGAIQHICQGQQEVHESDR